MTDTVLRVGLLGVGGVASKYAALYGEYPRSKLVAVYDTESAPAEALRRHFGCVLAPSAEALVAMDLDAVVISTPNHVHHAQTLAALAAGKHVLLQKPMTLNVTEAQDLVAASRSARRVLAMYMNSLDHPLFRDIRRMIESGALGRVGGYEARLANGMGHVWANRPANFWRGSKAATGGGCFTMLATHYLNLGQWLLDSDIVEAAADGGNLMCGHIEGEDLMTALVRFANGARGVIGASWCVKGEHMSVHGSDGFVSYVDNATLTIRGTKPFDGETIQYREPGKRLVVSDVLPPAMGDWRNPYNQHRRFVDAVLDGRVPDVPAEAGLRDMRALDAAYRALASGKREKVAP
jgi:UDP-N-acetyl-2-amino-2-deoxyglucuronate dehydrogenase